MTTITDFYSLTLEEARARALTLGLRLLSAAEGLKASAYTCQEFQGRQTPDPELVRIVRDRVLEAGAWIGRVESETKPGSEVNKDLQKLGDRELATTGGIVADSAGLVGMAAHAVLVEAQAAIEDEELLGPLASWSGPVSIVGRQAAAIGGALVEWGDPTRPSEDLVAGRGEVRLVR